MKIGELAAAVRIPVETIRYYERESLLAQVPRSEGKYRIYGPVHVDRLVFVRKCRSLDMTLDEIRVLLRFKDAPQAECGEVNALLDDHIGHVATRIKELRQLDRQLKALRQHCVGVSEAAHCGILNELTLPTSPGRTGAARAHVSGVHGHRGRHGRTSADKP
jgi:Cd(II)/Pb(II)-responsive transcriptional regulator